MISATISLVDMVTESMCILKTPLTLLTITQRARHLTAPLAKNLMAQPARNLMVPLPINLLLQLVINLTNNLVEKAQVNLTRLQEVGHKLEQETVHVKNQTRTNLLVKNLAHWNCFHHHLEEKHRESFTLPQKVKVQVIVDILPSYYNNHHFANVSLFFGR